VVAVSHDENRLRAVCLWKRAGKPELLWTRSSKPGDTDFRNFAAECGLSLGSEAESDKGRGKTAVVGFDSAGVVFYQIDVPSVDKKEIAAIVKLQAETRLPLPSEQMETAWRNGRVRDGQLSVTVAAARKDRLEGFVENFRDFEPTQIVLDCEGVIRAWRKFFGGSDEQAVVVNARSRNTQVCLADKGRLINAMSLDIGTEDFSDRQSSEELIEVGERFTQDMRSVLELFGCSESESVPIFVLSDSGSAVEAMASALASAGISAGQAPAEVQELEADKQIDPEQVYEYRVPLGLASMAIDGQVESLDVFERIYAPAGAQVKQHWYHSLTITGAIAVLMLMLLVGAQYGADVLNNRKLGRLQADAKFEQAIGRQKLIRAVAQQRPNILELISEINSGEVAGIKLGSFSFKKGQPVRLSGQADGDKQSYEFEKKLQDNKYIEDVRMTLTKDPKGEKLKFAITFHYRNFTKKKGRGPAGL